MGSLSNTIRSAKRGWLAALVLWVLFIWGNSLVPGDASTTESGFVLELLAPLIRALGVTDMDAAHTFIRKCGHFSEYAVLAVLAWKAFGAQAMALLCALGVAVPCIDETIQRFVPGRVGAVGDVLIDMAGFAAGLALCALLGKRARARTESPTFTKVT